MKKKKLLIDFLLYLYENGKITDYDFVFEKQAKKFLKDRKRRKKVDKMVSGKPLSLNELLMFQKNQLQRLQEIYSPFEIHGGGSYPEQYDVYNDGKKIAYILYRQGQFLVDFGDNTILILDDGSDDGIMEPIQRMDFLKQALEAIKLRINHCDAPEI